MYMSMPLAAKTDEPRPWAPAPTVGLADVPPAERPAPGLLRPNEPYCLFRPHTAPRGPGASAACSLPDGWNLCSVAADRGRCERLGRWRAMQSRGSAGALQGGGSEGLDRPERARGSHSLRRRLARRPGENLRGER